MSTISLLPSPLPTWLAFGLQFEGEYEIPGAKNNPKLMALLDESDGKIDGQVVGADNDDEAYCAKALSACLEHVNIRSTRSAWARSYSGWGEKIPAPALGCIVVLERGPKFGHVTFAVGRDKAGNLLGYGFNQSDGARTSAFELKRVIGYRWPEGVKLPTQIGLTTLPLLALKDGKVSKNEA